MQGSHGGHNGLDRGNAWDLGVSGTENDPKSWTKDVWIGGPCSRRRTGRTRLS